MNIVTVLGFALIFVGAMRIGMAHKSKTPISDFLLGVITLVGGICGVTMLH